MAVPASIGARRGGRCVAMIAMGVLVLATPAAGQNREPSAIEFGPGLELESYLRLLQVSGRASWYPWSIRGHSRRELTKMLRPDTAPAAWRIGPAKLNARFAVGPLQLNTTFNSAFPYGGNDGPVWAGRGLTVSAAASVTGRAGPVSLTLAPMGFITTNGSFPTMSDPFSDGLYTVDRPQRFGDGAYGRGDAGASEIRLDTRLLTIGFGTAPMAWGPAVEYPFILGANAPGFPHAFAGTGEPLNIGLGSIHGRAVWGTLAQSAYSPVTGSDRFVTDAEPGRDRLMTGLVLVFIPRFAPHLELGIARFAHLPFDEDGIDGGFVRKVWPTFLKANVSNEFVEAENELASVFARWTFPAAGFELYAEHGHDDWYNDLRDLSQEPEHNRAYVIGFQKIMGDRGDRLSAIRGEISNYEMPPLGRDRPGQGTIYTHSVLRQGHTHRGQLLGSSAGVGSAGASVLAWDRYSPAGRTTLAWHRIVRAHAGTFQEDGVADEDAVDVIHSLGVERSRGSAKLRYTLGVDVMIDLNRNFTRDVLNLNLRAGMQWSPGRAAATGR